MRRFQEEVVFTKDEAIAMIAIVRALKADKPFTDVDGRTNATVPSNKITFVSKQN